MKLWYVKKWNITCADLCKTRWNLWKDLKSIEKPADENTVETGSLCYDGGDDGGKSIFRQSPTVLRFTYSKMCSVLCSK